MPMVTKNKYILPSAATIDSYFKRMIISKETFGTMSAPIFFDTVYFTIMVVYRSQNHFLLSVLFLCKCTYCCHFWCRCTQEYLATDLNQILTHYLCRSYNI